LTQFLTTDEEGPKKALEMACQYGQIDGSHHKAWTIDQIVRALTGENYDRFIDFYRFTPDEDDEEALVESGITIDFDTDDREELYSWDEGIAP
jgi:hypothetical protein